MAKINGDTGVRLARYLFVLCLAAHCGGCKKPSFLTSEGSASGHMRVVSVEAVDLSQVNLIGNGDFNKWLTGAPAPQGFSTPNAAFSSLSRQEGAGAVQTWAQCDESRPAEELFGVSVNGVKANNKYALEVTATSLDAATACVQAWIIDAENNARPLARYSLFKITPNAKETVYKAEFSTEEEGRLVIGSFAPVGNAFPAKIQWGKWDLRDLDEAAEAARLDFTKDQSLGVLKTRDWNAPGWNWEELGQARGSIQVSPSKVTMLVLDAALLANLDPLTRLAPNTLQVLCVDNLPFTDEHLKIIAQIPGLRLLTCAGTKVTDKGLECLAENDTLFGVVLPIAISDAAIEPLKKSRPRPAECGLVPNGGFEGGTEGWNAKNPDLCAVDTVEGCFGKKCGRIVNNSPGGGNAWEYTLSVEKGRNYLVSAYLKADALEGKGFAFGAVYQFDAQEKVVKHDDFVYIRESADWNYFEKLISIDPNSSKVLFGASVYLSTGTLWVDNVSCRPVDMAPPFDAKKAKFCVLL